MSFKGFLVKTGIVLTLAGLYGSGVYSARDHYTAPFKEKDRVMKDSVAAVNMQVANTDSILTYAKEEFVPAMTARRSALMQKKSDLDYRIQANENVMNTEQLKAWKSWYYRFE
jgi:hypothetical protein